MFCHTAVSKSPQVARNEASMNVAKGAKCCSFAFTCNTIAICNIRIYLTCVLVSIEYPRASDVDAPQQWVSWTIPVGRWVQTVGHQSECGIQALLRRNPHAAPIPFRSPPPKQTELAKFLNCSGLIGDELHGTGGLQSS